MSATMPRELAYTDATMREHLPTDDEGIAELANLTAGHRLAHAVLLFYSAGPWTPHKAKLWEALTGWQEATTRSLCHLARQTRDEEKALQPWTTRRPQ